MVLIKSLPKAVAPVEGRRSRREQPAPQGCTTASLLRGRTYLYAGIPFDVGVAVEINEELIKRHSAKDRLGNPLVADDLIFELENLYEEVTDSDGEMWDKPIFDVQHDQPRPVSAQEADASRPKRVRQLVEVEPGQRPVKRAPLTPIRRR